MTTSSACRGCAEGMKAMKISQGSQAGNAGVPLCAAVSSPLVVEGPMAPDSELKRGSNAVEVKSSERGTLVPLL